MDVYKIDWEKVDEFSDTDLETFNQIRWHLKDESKPGAKCMQDFYEAIGIDWKKYNKELNRVIDVSNEIFCNEKTDKKISEYIKSKYKGNYKNRGEEFIYSGILGDLLNYMPNSVRKGVSENIPDDEIHVIIQKDKFKDEMHHYGKV